MRVYAIIGVLAAICLYMSYHYGQKSAALKATAEIAKHYKARGVIDEKFDGRDLVLLCIDLGGVREQCTKQLRRLVKVPQN